MKFPEGSALSPLVLGRENVFTRLADSIGLPDIELELADFNRAFSVKCKDRKFANDFLDQRMMRLLLGPTAASRSRCAGSGSSSTRSAAGRRS